MNVFLTNDDGYTAKGLAVLARIMHKIVGEDGSVDVIAPKEHQSGSGVALTLGLKPIVYKDLGIKDGVSWAYLGATPASCVKFATNFRPMPDVVVSGINHGINASTAALYSGTLGAAAEGAVNGILSIGVSIDSGDPDADFSSVEEFFPLVFSLICSNPSNREGVFYNVNIPALPPSMVRGIRVGAMGRGRWVKEYASLDSPKIDERGLSRERLMEKVKIFAPEEGEEVYFMLGEYEDSPNNGPDADHHLVADGYISIVAHNIYSTDEVETARLRSCGFERDF